MVENGGKRLNGGKLGNMLEYGGKLTEWWKMIENGGKRWSIS